MNLSSGERPVCRPVRTTSGPSAAIRPSPWRIASSTSSARETLARTVRPRAGRVAAALWVTIEGSDSLARAITVRIDRPRVTLAEGERESASTVAFRPTLPRCGRVSSRLRDGAGARRPRTAAGGRFRAHSVRPRDGWVRATPRTGPSSPVGRDLRRTPSLALGSSVHGTRGRTPTPGAHRAPTTRTIGSAPRRARRSTEVEMHQGKRRLSLILGLAVLAIAVAFPASVAAARFIPPEVAGAHTWTGVTCAGTPVSVTFHVTDRGRVVFDSADRWQGPGPVGVAWVPRPLPWDQHPGPWSGRTGVTACCSCTCSRGAASVRHPRIRPAATRPPPTTRGTTALPADPHPRFRESAADPPAALSCCPGVRCIWGTCLDAPGRGPVASADNRRALIKSWLRDRPVDATTTYRPSRQGANSGQDLLRDMGLPSEPP